jgi:hypothetical protein
LFRRRFNELRLKPLLDYGTYSRMKGGEYRFIGGFESITDEHILWICSEDLTIPVDIAGAQIYLLPMQEGQGMPDVFDPGEEVPERIRWDRLSALAGGAKVFVGGTLTFKDKRWTFVSGREMPLLVIIYDGPDPSLTVRAIRAGRHRNEYWNPVTPYSLLSGALCLIFFAVSFLSRPAFRLTALTALIAVFTPLFPLVPPGVLCTVIYRRLWWRARLFRAYRDLARLPLAYLPRGGESCRLSGGEWYGVRCCDVLPDGIPPLIPPAEKRKKDQWYVFGVLDKESPDLPAKPEDVFATFGAVPGKPELLARRYTFRAYALETAAWLLLLAGIGLNVFFITMIIILL